MKPIRNLLLSAIITASVALAAVCLWMFATGYRLKT